MDFIIVFAGLIAMGYLYQGIEFTDQATFKIQSVKFDLKQSSKTLFTKLFFDINAILDNPTGFSITLKSIDLTLGINGKIVATVHRSDSLTISANNKINVMAPVQVNTFDLFSSAAAAAAQLKSGITANIAGVIQLTAGMLNINQNIKIV